MKIPAGLNRFYLLSKKTIFFLLLVLSPVVNYAQTEPSTAMPQLPNIIPPSPTVANLMRFEEVPVDNYTGQPDISIPLLSKQKFP